MISLLVFVALGFVLGMRHATDPDHVVAVTTIVSRERKITHAAMIGALWGLGHTVTIITVGSAIILLKLAIPPWFGLSMELSVGVVLILLGMSNLTGLMSRIVERFTFLRLGAGSHAHVIFGRLIIHNHRGYEESIVLGRLPAWRRLGLFQIARPVAVGIVHGLAGSAAVTLLVLTTITRPAWAIGYLLVFGFGTVVGMMLITAVIALPFAYTTRHFAQLNQGLAVASGVLSVSFGLFLCYQIVVSDGLFTGHPQWMPH